MNKIHPNLRGVRAGNIIKYAQTIIKKVPVTQVARMVIQEPVFLCVG